MIAKSASHLTTASLRTLWTLLIATTMALTSLEGQEKHRDPAQTEALEGFRKMDHWDVRVFQLPFHRLSQLDWDKRDKGAAERMAAVKAALEAQVGALPEGSTFLTDGATATLAAKSTHEALERIGHFCESECHGDAVVIAFKLEVFESRSGTDAKLHEALLTQHDHTLHAEVLRKQVDKGEVRLLAMTQWTGRSGEKTTVINTGRGDGPHLKVEMDPTVSPGMNVAVNFHFEYRDEASELLRRPDSQSEATITTALTINRGTSRVIGMWKPRGSARDVSRTAVLTVNVLPVLPEISHQLAAKLRGSDSAALRQEIVPASNPGDIPVPKGMVLRQLPCRFNLFLLWQDYKKERKTAVDPFAPSQEGAVVEPPSNRTGSPQEILEQQGIPFPAGSRVYYHRSNSTLVVLNTPENIESVEGFLDGISVDRPNLLRFELQIVEGEAAHIRPLIAATEGLSDHTTAWKRMEEMVAKGELKQSALMISETRSGQKIWMFAGEQIGHEPEKEDMEDREKDEPARFGTRLVPEIIIGPDGYTLEVSLDLEHDGLSPVENTNSHPPSQSIKAATVMTNGHPALLGVWKLPGASPSGKEMLQAAFFEVHITLLDLY